MRQLLTKRWLIVGAVVVMSSVAITDWAWAASSSTRSLPGWYPPAWARYVKR
jgi:hypothetical protein